MKAPKRITLDFETDGIEPRPHYPPKPVGFSIRWPGEKRSKYWAFAHPEGNNCTREQARRELSRAWKSGIPLLGQNMKFDVDVAQTHMDMPKISWERVHDTLYLLFLADPYARSFSLKPSAERILNIPSTERDDVRDWIIANVSEARRSPKKWGAYICRAPGGLVGRYADGDVLRTDKLFDHLYPSIYEQDMLEAYDRERQLMPIMLANEREGIRVNLPLLERDFKIYTAALEKADIWLRKKLGVKDLNIDADNDMADALEAAGVVTEWNYTAPTKRHPEGQRSVSKKNLTADMFNDKRVASVFGYRNILSTCLGTFMEPWLHVARETGGRIHTQWNQVRGEEKGGAKTGRFSSSPNFQNIPKNWKKAIADGYVYPAFLRVPELPNMRQYFLPDERSHLWGRRDYNQQELRLLAHFEDGQLMQNYINDPRLKGAEKKLWYDIHRDVQQCILEEVGIELPRDPTKILNFADIYGRGQAMLAVALNTDIQTIRRLRKAKDKLLPGIRQLNEALIKRGKAGLPIRTWGGRLYLAQPPGYSKKYKKVMDFYYKLLNYLIQGSASDVTKESIIRYHAHPKCGPRTGNARFLVTVHDENDISAPKRAMKHEMTLLRDVMQSVKMDVPMLSDGEIGKDWGHLQELKEDTRLNFQRSV